MASKYDKDIEAALVSTRALRVLFATINDDPSLVLFRIAPTVSMLDVAAEHLIDNLLVLRPMLNDS